MFYWSMCVLQRSMPQGICPTWTATWMCVRQHSSRIISCCPRIEPSPSTVVVVAGVLAGNGYKVVELSVGYDGWVKAGGATEK